MEIKNKSHKLLKHFSFSLVAVAGALIFVSIILWIADAQPGLTFQKLIQGAFGDATKIANGFVVWVPLSLVAGAFIITFTAGLWNLGIEGQIMLGAIFTTGLMRSMQTSALPPAVIIFLSCLMGMVGGRDIRGSGAELCRDGVFHLVDFWTMETPRGGFDERHRTL